MSEGGFTHDGSYVQGLAPGRVTSLVKSLVQRRQAGKLTPSQAKEEIASSGLLKAFPSSIGWVHEHWANCVTTTSAEQAVKMSGGSPDGHWCAGNWIHGPEKECRMPGHRSMPDAEEVRRLVATLSRAFGG